MKIKLSVLSLVVVALVFSAISVFGQPIPTGPYVCQPERFGYTRISVVWSDHAKWPERFTFSANIIDGTNVIAMSFAGGSADMGTAFTYSYSRMEPPSNFKDLDVWKAFAVKVSKGFVFLGNGTYVEQSPFSFVGRSVFIGTSGQSESKFVFTNKNTGNTLLIPSESWMGPKPEIGKLLNIGRFVYRKPIAIVDRVNPSTYSDCMFPAKMGPDGNYVMSEEMISYLKKIAADY